MLLLLNLIDHTLLIFAAIILVFKDNSLKVLILINHLCACYWVPLVCLLSFESIFFSIFRSKTYRSPFLTVAPSVTCSITTTHPS
jgi:hypothetical protein